jgi:hypothetical protein
MDESLTSVNAEQESAEGSQIASTEVATGESESAVVAEQQVTEEKTESTPVKQEHKQQTPEENAAWKALRLEEKQRAEQAAAQRAIDSEYADLAQRYGVTNLDGTPVKTKAEWTAVTEFNAKVAALTNTGLSEEDARLRVKVEQLEREKQDREKADRERQVAEESRQTKQKQFADFLETFKTYNGRPWTEADGIPMEVVTEAEAGTPLKYAYADYYARQQVLKNKNLEVGKKMAEVNAQNATTAAGSVSGGTSTSAEITLADIDAHANDTGWMMKNYKKVSEVLSKKKG